jgi:hypothetical protein
MREILGNLFGIELPKESGGSKNGISGINTVTLPGKELKLASAKTIVSNEDGSPAVTVNSYGKGKAVLVAYNNKNEISESVLKQLIGDTGIENLIIKDAGGNITGGYQIYAFEYNTFKYIGVIADRFKPGDHIDIGGIKPVYDIRRREFAGITNRISLDGLENRGVGLYALAPYRIRNLNISINSPVVKLGEALKFNADLATFENAAIQDHMVHISLFYPDGQEAVCYRKDVEMKGGKLEGEIGFALNEPTGTWKIKIRDIASGKETERTFILSKNEQNR